MKIHAFSCTLLLLSLILYFSSGIYAQSRNSQQKLNMEFTGTKLMGELINVIPMEVRDVQPPAARFTTCVISGQVAGDRPAYGTHINLFVSGDRNPRVSVSVINWQYTIPNVPEGSYEVKSKMDNPMTPQTPRGPIGLKLSREAASKFLLLEPFE